MICVRFASDLRQMEYYLEFASKKLEERLVEWPAESQKKIFKLIAKNSKMPKQELSKNIGIGTTAVDENISSLKKKGLLKRIGHAKGGHWKVIIKKNLKK
ncbi:MAG: winged helix-turn-helix transcriptional regulator [Nanoarchaeota archaeon]|nr:winged helix-turn-helix transcriptional regulator [Nanoarchaeota archaeon]